MNETQSAGKESDAETKKKNLAPFWRAIPAVLGVVLLVAVGILVGLHPENTTVSVRFLGHHFIVARGGAPAAVAPMALIFVGIFLPAWAIIDALRTPKAVFSSLGRSKVRWIASMIILFFVGDLSLLAVPIYYLLRVRPQLNRKQEPTSQ